MSKKLLRFLDVDCIGKPFLELNSVTVLTTLRKQTAYHISRPVTLIKQGVGNPGLLSLVSY